MIYSLVVFILTGFDLLTLNTYPVLLCFLHRLLNPLMSFPVYFYADYIFWSFGIVELILSYSDNRVLLKPVLGGVASVAHSITGCCIVVLRPW